MQRTRHNNNKKNIYGMRKGLLDDDDEKYHQEPSMVSWCWPLILLAVGIVLFHFVYISDHTLPKAVSIEDIRLNPNLFSGERSRMLSQRFQILGPRIVGDDANEIASPKIIKEEVDTLIKNAHPAQSIKITRQKGSGAFILGFKPPFINVYENVQNVIVKVEGSEGLHSVLVNCHYDTVPTSYGASDNAISCSAMLEIIRILSITSTRLKHNVVFLFNGAEESLVQASHLFLRHEWAKQCRIVLNLEAAGLGGRNILFQSGPNNAWLFKYYASSVPYPHGQVLGEELFQHSIIPSDTDFRIFRDFGNIPGLDFAFWQNGFVYHTKYDHEKYLPVGSHQNVGENTLALINAFGNAPELNNIQAHSEGQMVYYDYLGWFMVSHSVGVNIFLNTTAIILGFLSIVFFIGFPWRWSVVGELAIAILARFTTMAVAMVAVSIVAIVIDKIAPLVMPWYSNPWLIFPIYWCPCLIVHIIVPYIFDSWRSNKRNMAVAKITQMNLVAAQIPGILILFVTTALGARSGALIFLPVISSSIANLVINSTSLSRSAYKWIWVYLVIHLPSLLFTLYMVEMVYMFFIPVFGRIGTINNDLVLAVLSTFFLFYVMNFALPLMSLVKKPGYTIAFLASFSFIIIGFSLTTYMGHPYKVDTDQPRPQRYFILHTYREFRDENQSVRRNESGYLIFNQDRNSPRTLQINESQLKSLSDDCNNELFCGLPLYSSRMLKTSSASHWIPAGKPHFPIETELKLFTRNCNAALLKCDYTFSLYGPDRKTLTFAPREGAKLINWDLSTDIFPTGEWQGRPSYLIHIASGVIVSPTNITLSLNVSPKQLEGSPALDIGLAGNHIHHDSDRTDEFKEFLKRLPDWTQLTTFISAYKSYVF